MKKLLKNKKFVLYAALILVVVLMWVCGSLNTTKSSASYRSTISSNESSAKVAKWNIISVDKDGSVMDLEVGFKEKISDTGAGKSGEWFLDLENDSEVSAMIDSESKIVLELHHDTFTGKSQDNWDFLGTKNPLRFIVELYDKPITEVVTTDSNGDKVLNPSVVADKVIVDTKLTPKLTSSAIVNGKIVYLVEVSLSEIFKDADLDLLKFKLDDTSPNKVLRLAWDIDDTSIIVVDELKDLENQEKNEAYTYVVGSGASAKKYRWNGTSFEEITTSNASYYRYELSTTKGTTAPGTSSTGYTVLFGSDNETFYINQIACDFADYFLFSHGEPTFTFGSTKKSYKVLTDAEKTEINARTISSSSTYDELKLYMEKLELPQYDRFQKEYVAFTSGSIYLSYGLTCKIKFELKVTQVD